MEYIFTLKYQLGSDVEDMDAVIERLGEAGCDDALAGIGLPGRLALEFTREAPSAEAAVGSALDDVRRALPDARLIEAAPDLVGLTDVAEIAGVSRQAMRKLMLAYPGSFPVPVHEGTTSLWHLADLLEWLRAGQRRLAARAGGSGAGRLAGQPGQGKAPGLRLRRRSGRVVQQQVQADALAVAHAADGVLEIDAVVAGAAPERSLPRADDGGVADA